jgi:HEAT repeat protein
MSERTSPASQETSTTKVRGRRISPALLLLDADGVVRRSAVAALAADPSNLRLLLARLPDEDSAEVRADIFAALLKHPSAMILEGLVPLLRSESAVLHEGVVQWLLAVLDQGAESAVCAAAIDLLGEVGDHRAVPALRAAKTRFRGNVLIQFSADVALGQIE